MHQNWLRHQRTRLEHFDRWCWHLTDQAWLGSGVWPQNPWKKRPKTYTVWVQCRKANKSKEVHWNHITWYKPYSIYKGILVLEHAPEAGGSSSRWRRLHEW